MCAFRADSRADLTLTQVLSDRAHAATETHAAEELAQLDSHKPKWFFPPGIRSGPK
jgi:hypothetical protein